MLYRKNQIDLCVSECSAVQDAQWVRVVYTRSCQLYQTQYCRLPQKQKSLSSEHGYRWL